MRKKIGLVFVVLLSVLVFSLPTYAVNVDDTSPTVLANSADSEDDAPGWLAEARTFVVGIFIPEPEYFHNKLGEIQREVSNKFGGLSDLYRTLQGFFTSLQSAQTANFVFSIPDDYFWEGYRGGSFNIFAAAGPYLRLLRGVLNGLVCLMTAIICYHKLRTFFAQGGETV